MLASIYWGVVVILLPIFLWPKIQEDNLTSKMLLFCVLAFTGALALNKNKNFPKILLLVPLYAFLNCYVYDSVTVILQIVGLCSGLLIIHSVSNVKINKRMFLNFLSLACVIQSAWIISNYFGFNPYLWFVINIYNKVTNQNMGIVYNISALDVKEIIGYLPGGSLSNGMYSVAILVATIPSLIRKKFWPLLFPAFWAVFLSNSTMGLAASVSGVVFFILFKVFKSKKIVAFSFLFVCLSFVCICIHGFPNTQFAKDSGRTVHWKQMLEMPRNKITGFGLGFLADQFKQYQDGGNPRKHYTYAHNEYLEAYLALGYFGIFILLYLLWDLYKRDFDPFLTPSLLGLLVNYSGTFNLHIAGASIFFCVIYGIILKQQPENNYEKTYFKYPIPSVN